jgi:hypothetical protein
MAGSRIREVPETARKPRSRIVEAGPNYSIRKPRAQKDKDTESKIRGL